MNDGLAREREGFFGSAKVVASLTMLLSRSKLFAPVRNKLPDWTPIQCPVCLTFWISLPLFYFGFVSYLASVTFANAWMLVIAKLYLAIDDMDYPPE